MLDKTAMVPWPPRPYRAVLNERAGRLKRLRNDPDLLASAKAAYRLDPVRFINEWAVVHEPRTADLEDSYPILPMTLFPRQVDFIEFIYRCFIDKENGLNEKSRDMGATWCAVWFSVWVWLFFPGGVVGWGTATADKLDLLGDPDTIFEKIRMALRSLPSILLPVGFDESNLTLKRIINPENGAAIIGQIGLKIGRGGRATIFFKDEAQPLWSKILTPSGWKMMGEIRVGSSVIGRDGRSCKVTQIKNFDDCPIYRVSFTDGTFTHCSPNHLWSLENAFVGGEVKINTKELSKTYKSGKVGHNRYRALFPDAIKFEQKEQPELHPYLVGALLGDGAINKGTPQFSSADWEIVQSFKNLLPDYCTITRSGNYGYRICDIRGRYGRARSRAKMLVINAGIFGKTAKNKFVPDCYKFSSVEDRLALLQGLMDTDGGTVGASFVFSSGSIRLAQDVQFLAQSLGGCASISAGKTIPIHGTMPIYKVFLYLPSGIIPFRLSRKIKRMKAQPRKQAIRKRVCDVELVGRSEARCISVDAKDGLYLTDHCIVTHNSAHYEHPEAIEASLSHTTDVQMDISSVSGPNTVFHNKRETGVEWNPNVPMPKKHLRVFVMDWRDHPLKTQEWYDLGAADFKRKGLSHLWAQEVDRDYGASIAGIIIPSAWVKAAIDAHIKLDIPIEGGWTAGLDIADMGGDTNALATRRGVILSHLDEWGEGEGSSGPIRKAVSAVRDLGVNIDVQYDAAGIGLPTKWEYNSWVKEGTMPKGVRLIPWHAGGGVVDPDKNVLVGDKKTPKNKDYFQNFKAQAWWSLRMRFWITYRAMTEEGFNYDTDDCISLPRELPFLQKAIKELSQPTWVQSSSLKMMVDKVPEGARSPNIADAICMAFFPVRSSGLPIVSEAGMNWARMPSDAKKMVGRRWSRYR